MKSTPIGQSWQNILSITQTMEQSATSEDWHAVANSASKRHKMIKHHFTLFVVGPDTAEFYYQHLSQFLCKEEQLQTLASNAQKQVLKQNLTLVSNKRAASAYQASGNL
jgi:hypothetical protein